MPLPDFLAAVAGGYSWCIEVITVDVGDLGLGDGVAVLSLIDHCQWHGT